MDIQQILQMCVQYNSSDVHILVGIPPMLRLNGKLTAVPEMQPVTPKVAEELITPLLSPTQREMVNVDRELDFSYAIQSGERFRANVYYEKGNLAAALRYIPSRIRSLEELTLPPILAQLTRLKQGLVLVTGPTGHGKSTTLAAMIDRVNNERAEHVVTIEDPIEFVYQPKKSIISQRELHADTHAWTVALRSVLREDPNVVLIGEMRDYDTIESAITIAETGHLVLATLHTNSAAQTIDRIVGVFPEEQQQQVRLQLSMSLEAIISQRLIPSIDNKQTVVCEILIATPAVRSLIRDAKTQMLPNTMQTSTDAGMCTLEMALADAYAAKRISLATAREFAPNLDEINRLVEHAAI